MKREKRKREKCERKRKKEERGEKIIVPLERETAISGG
jgi:hypothetical protein